MPLIPKSYLVLRLGVVNPLLDLMVKTMILHVRNNSLRTGLRYPT